MNHRGNELEKASPVLINNPDTRSEGGDKSILDEVKRSLRCPISIKVTPVTLEEIKVY
jgi:hypothetical protein